MQVSSWPKSRRTLKYNADPVHPPSLATEDVKPHAWKRPSRDNLRRGRIAIIPQRNTLLNFITHKTVMNHALKSARRPSYARAAVLCATALCISCTTKVVLEPITIEGKAPPDTLSVQAFQIDMARLICPGDRFELKTPGYTYVGGVDYVRIAQQAARSFRDYVRHGANSSRKLFLISIGLLIEGKNYLKQGVNLGYLLRDPVYSAIRGEFRNAKPDDGAEDFLDAIAAVKASEGSDSLRADYGDGFVNAVLKYSR